METDRRQPPAEAIVYICRLSSLRTFDCSVFISYFYDVCHSVPSEIIPLRAQPTCFADYRQILIIINCFLFGDSKPSFKPEFNQ